MDLELMLELFDLFEVGYDFICVIRVCKDVIKLFFVDILVYYISFDELYYKIGFCFMLIVGNDKFSLDELKCWFFLLYYLFDYKIFDFFLFYKFIKYLCFLLRLI